MSVNVKWDDKAFQKKMSDAVGDKIRVAVKKSTVDIAFDILRICTNRVPHDKGMLQNSGTIDQDPPEYTIVGYNKVYAARLHEHPEYRFQKGREGKWLERGIALNLTTFQKFYQDMIKKVFS